MWVLCLTPFREGVNILPEKTKQCSHKSIFYGLISCQRPCHNAFKVLSEASELSLDQTVSNVCLCVTCMSLWRPQITQLSSKASKTLKWYQIMSLNSE